MTAEFRNPDAGPFNELLVRIGEREDDRQAGRRGLVRAPIRLGISDGHRAVSQVPMRAAHRTRQRVVQVPRVHLFERTAMHAPSGTVVAGDPRAVHPTMTTVASDEALLRALRGALVSQERVTRNRTWMKTQLERRTPSQSHG